jgi:hypothetical protein
MNWLAVIMMCSIGMYILGDKEDIKETKDNKGTNKNVKTYSKDYCRKHLSAAYYDNWDCERIARQIREDYRIKEELEYLLRSGYSFERSIDELVKEEKINLKNDYIVSAY